jgi:hypothetical protein
METRRTFLTGLALVGACSCLASDPVRGQSPAAGQAKLPSNRPPGDDTPKLPDPEKKILEDNDKDMKKKVEALYELAKELKQEVEKTDSTRVLSVNLMKKAEEIEKLAHDIKNRSKG